MRRFVVDRGRLLVPANSLPSSLRLDLPALRARLDTLGFPDGMPFALEDDGRVGACASLNRYVQEAVAESAYTTNNLAHDRMPVLFNLLRWLCRREAERLASQAGIPLTTWLTQHDEPQIDLLSATKADLIAYRDHRLTMVTRSTVNTQMGYVSSFYRHAYRERWIERDPVPQWGNRNTLLVQGRTERRARFLTVTQAWAFLQRGLRGDGSDDRPSAPERDHLYGLLLVTTGLRRVEGAWLLDCELPHPGEFAADGVYAISRVGKRGVTRSIYMSQALSEEAALYRATE